MKKIDKSSSTPLHIQIQSMIKDMIFSGELKEGEAILPEREICREQDVSRMTVNKAINALVSEGLLYRVQGKGTFVAEKKKKYQFRNANGFTEVMRSKGIEIRTDILKFEMMIPDDEIREKLEITNKNENVYKIARLRYVENDPFVYEIAYLSERICEGITKGMLDNRSLYELLDEKFGYRVKSVDQIIEPIELVGKERELLKCDAGRLALKIQRKSYNEAGVLIEYTVSIIRSDKYQYELNIGM